MLSEEMVVIESGPSKFQPVIYPPEVLEAAAPLYERAIVVRKFSQGGISMVDPADILGRLEGTRWNGSAVVAKLRHVVPPPPAFRLAHSVLAKTERVNESGGPMLKAERIDVVEYVVAVPVED